MNIFSPTMKTAWLVLSAIGVASLLITSETSVYAQGLMLYISICLLLLYSAAVVFLISKLAAGGPATSKAISTWGYVWRATVVKYSALIPAGLACLLIFGRGPYISVPVVLFLSGLHVLISIVFIWAFFSSDRKGQISWLFTLIRGG